MPIIDFFDKLHTYFKNQPEFPLLQQYIQFHTTANLSIESEHFFEIYLDHLLDFLQIPRMLGSSKKELFPIYHLFHKIDPLYFTEEQISTEIRKCSSLSLKHQEALEPWIVSFFQLICQWGAKSDLLQHLADHPGVYGRLAPSSHHWEFLSMLQNLGAEVVASQPGYRSWSRCLSGKLPESNHSPELWNNACHNWANSKNLSPIVPDLLAHAFAGQLQHLGINGICGDIPNCEACIFQKQCKWYDNPELSLEELPVEEIAHKDFIEEAPLSDLLSYILGLTSEEKEALEDKLEKPNGLRGFDRASLYDLGQIFHKNPAIAKKLKIIIELCKRYNEKLLTSGHQFQSSDDIFNHFRFRLRDQKQEFFLLILLNNKHQFLSEIMITKGTLNRSLVHPREVFSTAIENRAAAIICVHNHPSGDPIASQEDIQVTRRLTEVGKLVGIPILDHVIIGNDQYFSLADHSLL